MSKKCQKTRFLMGKSTFSLKITQLDKKITKNDQKSSNIQVSKNELNLTTKRGDSGSAGTPGEKCVIIWAPKFDTKMSKN